MPLFESRNRQLVDFSKIIFDKPSNYDKSFYPGEQALRFYTDFALPSKEVYTWNKDLPESFEMFSAGKLSMMFGYSYQLPLLRAQAPKINLGVAPMLHINSDGTDAFGAPINWANYWLFTVFKNSKHTSESWDFLKFLSTQKYTDEDGSKKYYVEDYLNISKNPPALRDLIDKYKQGDDNLSLFRATKYNEFSSAANRRVVCLAMAEVAPNINMFDMEIFLYSCSRCILLRRNSAFKVRGKMWINIRFKFFPIWIILSKRLRRSEEHTSELQSH